MRYEIETDMVIERGDYGLAVIKDDVVIDFCLLNDNMSDNDNTRLLKKWKESGGQIYKVRFLSPNAFSDIERILDIPENYYKNDIGEWIMSTKNDDEG